MPANLISSSEKRNIDSTPSRKFCQNSSRFLAPGKRPLIPIIAILSAGRYNSELLIRDCPPMKSVHSSAHCLWRFPSPLLDDLKGGQSAYLQVLGLWSGT